MTRSLTTIEHARKADVPELIRIMHCVPAAPQWTAAQVAALFSAEGANLLRLVPLAKRDSVIAGFAVISLVPGTDPVEAELESIAVVPDQQKRGIGRMLLDAASAWARQQNASVLRLEVRQSNVAATRLYAKAGWTQVAVRPCYYTHPIEDALIMERRSGAD